jgi:DNA-binding CsgD family transcriptional regulator
MMAISISNGASVAQVYTPQASSKDKTQVSTVASKSSDTVRLTQSQQIHAMKQQGQGASQIASAMGVSLASVDGVLGIVVAKTSSPAVETTSAAADTSKATVVDTAANAKPVAVVDTKASGTPAPALVDVQA